MQVFSKNKLEGELENSEKELKLEQEKVEEFKEYEKTQALKAEELVY